MLRGLATTLGDAGPDGEAFTRAWFEILPRLAGLVLSRTPGTGYRTTIVVDASSQHDLVVQVEPRVVVTKQRAPAAAR